MLHFLLNCHGEWYVLFAIITSMPFIGPYIKKLIGGKMKVKVMKLDAGAIIPKYAKHGDAGMDLYATSQSFDEHGNYVYGTGLAMEIPKGYVGLIFPRSSISKTAHSLRNAVGVIDSGYRGEIMMKFDINTQNSPVYEIGERVAQIIILPYPQIEFEEAWELSKTERGKGGFGSTNKGGTNE